MSDATTDVPNSCSICEKVAWTCLGCQDVVPVAAYATKRAQPVFLPAAATEAAKEVNPDCVAVFCNCCNHQFVCGRCYAGDAGHVNNAGYAYWRPKFGEDHVVYDRVSAVNPLTMLLTALTRGMVDVRTENGIKAGSLDVDGNTVNVGVTKIGDVNFVTLT
jgi:hypothetical protein